MSWVENVLKNNKPRGEVYKRPESREENDFTII